MEFSVLKNLFLCINENNCLKLNAQILLKYGMDNKDISTLINKNILQRRIKGEYGVSLEYIYLYIKKLSRAGYVDQALEYFLDLKKMMQLTSNSKHYLAIVNYESICYQIFKLYIFKDEYNQAYDYFKRCSKRNYFFNQICHILFDYLLDNNGQSINKNTTTNQILRLEEIKKDCENNNFDLALKKLCQLELNSNLMDLKLSDSKIKVLKRMLARSIEKQNGLFDLNLDNLEKYENSNMAQDLNKNSKNHLGQEAFGKVLSRKKNS